MGFYERVWLLLTKIPIGRVTTYGEIARALGKKSAARVVGNACNANPNAPKVPCHRVVAAGGKIGGYSEGLERKIRLLGKEGIKVRAGMIEGFEQKNYRFNNPP